MTGRSVTQGRVTGRSVTKGRVTLTSVMQGIVTGSSVTQEGRQAPCYLVEQPILTVND